jgi:hypothetical protein
MAEVDKYFELSSHPGSGAMVIHSVEGNTATLLPSLTSLDVTPATSARRCGIRLLYGAGRW